MKQARILIVEDESIVAKDIQKTLQSFGYDVPCITLTGEDAIDKARVLQPDLVLMDIILAGDMDGIEAAREIKHRYKIPIIFLTAYIDENLMDNREPFEYIIKPIDEDELKITVDRVLASPVPIC
jgi:CheY-like chemotaxis protein